MRTSLCTSACLILAACAGSPRAAPTPVPQASPDSAAIGIAVRIRAPIRLVSIHPDAIYFVWLAQGDEPYRGGRVIASNFSKGGYYYLLNAPPGHYVAVAAFKRSSGGRPPRTFLATTMFGDSVRRATDATVVSGSIAFMGALVLDESVGLDRADSIQAQLVQFVASGVPYRATLHEVHREPQAEAQFLAAARTDLAGSGWIGAIERRLAALAAH